MCKNNNELDTLKIKEYSLVFKVYHYNIRYISYIIMMVISLIFIMKMFIDLNYLNECS